MASKIQVRRDTLSNWNANNPVLSSGEIAFVTDENKIKIGDGASAFTALSYLEADAYLDSVVMGDDTTGNYVETLIASDGISISGEGAESASVTITNTGVLSLEGTTNEIEVSASSGNITLGLPTSITVDLVGSVTGNADTASTLATARSISLGGDLSGSASFDGGSDITITAAVADDSHNHIVSNVDGLQDELNLKAPLESPSLTGTPTAPTASASTNSTQIATTAFVQTNISNLINGAPGALDTLDELAAALGDDANFASTVTNSLAGKQPLDADLTAIAELSASATGFLKKDAENTWSLDTNTYLTGNETITVSGDATGSGSTSISLTLANSGVSASTYGSSSQIPVLAVDAKGRITSASVASVEGLPSQTSNSGKYLTTNGTAASWDTINLGTDTDGDYVARLSVSGEGLSVTGSGESASVTLSNTGVTSLSGTANEVEVSASSGSVTLSLPSTINANTTGSASTLTTARVISLGGDLSGSASFNGGSNITITATVADDSHNHIISNVDGLQSALDAKLDSSSYTASDVLAKLLTVDGASSGLDADLLDGQSSAYYRNVANMNAGTLAIARGGTNTTATPTGGGIAYGTGTAIAYTAAGTAGQVLTSNGTSAPTWQAAASGGFDGFFLAGL